MKRNVKNDKVIKAMTIGLAAMIAATSMPMNVYADDDIPEESGSGEEGGSGDNGGGEEAGGGEENNGGGEQQAAEVNSAVAEANTIAEALVPSTPALAADGAVASDVTNPVGLIPAAVVAVNGLGDALTEGQVDGQAPQGVTDALGQLNEASRRVGEVKVDLLGIEAAVVTGGELGGTPVEAVYSVPATEEVNVGEADEKPVEAKSIRVLNTSETEEQEGKADYYSDETPVGGGDNGPASVDYYDREENGTDFYDSAEEEKPFIKSIVSDYMAAVENVEEYLGGNTDETLMVNAYDAAAEADRKLTIEENKIKALDEAIKDSRAAEEAVKKAKEDLKAVKTIKTKYDSMMKQYFEDMIGKSVVNDKNNNLLNDDGSINAQACVAYLQNEDNAAKALEELKKKDTNNTYGKYVDSNKGAFENALNYKALMPGDGVTTSARVLFCDLTKQYIEEQLHGSDVKFTIKGGSEKSADELSENDAKTLPKTQIGGNVLGGRNWRFAVSFIPEGGTEEDRETRYFNYVYKSTLGAAKDNLDIENGIFNLSEIKEVKEGKDKGKWVVVEDVKTPYDNYDLYASGGLVDAAVKAVAAAETKSADLKAAVNAIRNKILGVTPADREKFDGDDAAYNDYLDGKFADLKTAAKYSRVKLNALRELIGERPVINNGGGNGGGEEGGGEGTGGGTYDPGTGTLVIPGYEIPPITLPTTPSGVAGVRAAATRPTGVLGVKAPETKAEKVIANKTVVKPAAKKTVAQKGKKIADPETPLAATPFVDEDGMKIPWIWLLIIAALGAVGKKMYDEHKKKVQAEEEAKKYND